MVDSDQKDKELTEKEIRRRREDEVLRRMLNTPPKLHKDSIKGSRGTTKKVGDRRLSNKG